MSGCVRSCLSLDDGLRRVPDITLVTGSKPIMVLNTKSTRNLALSHLIKQEQRTCCNDLINILQSEAGLRSSDLNHVLRVNCGRRGRNLKFVLPLPYSSTKIIQTCSITFRNTSMASILNPFL